MLIPWYFMSILGPEWKECNYSFVKGEKMDERVEPRHRGDDMFLKNISISNENYLSLQDELMFIEVSKQKWF